MDLSEIITQVFLQQRDGKNWLWGLGIRGKTRMSWFKNNYFSTKTFLITSLTLLLNFV